jgi:hypothetical protein
MTASPCVLEERPQDQKGLFLEACAPPVLHWFAGASIELKIAQAAGLPLVTGLP